MPILNLQTLIQSTNQASSNEGAKSNALDETQLVETAAQFSGAFTQALQQTQPQPDGNEGKLETLTQATQTDTLSVEKAAENILPEPTGPQPAFPLNMIAALQSLFSPKAGEIAAATGQPAPQPELAVTSVAPETKTLQSETPIANLSEASKPVDKQTTDLLPHSEATGQINIAMLVDQPEQATTESIDVENPTFPAQKSGAASESQNTEPQDAAVSFAPASVTDTGNASAIIMPQAVDVALLVTAAPFSQSGLQPETLITSEQPTPQVSDLLPSVQNNLPISPKSVTTQNTQPAFENAVNQPVTQAATNSQPLLDTPIVDSPIPTTVQNDGASKASVTSEMATPPLTESGVLPALAPEKADAKPAPKLTESVTNTSASVETLQAISQQLQTLNGKIEAPTAPVQKAPSFEAAETQNNNIPLSENTSNAMPVQPVITTDGPAAPASPSPVDSGKLPSFISHADNVADQVVEGATYSLKNGHQELVIRLNPDNLGEVRVNLSTAGKDAVSARLIASSTESHEALQSQISHLRTSLESHGIQLERLSVVVAGTTESSSGSNTSGQQQQSEHKSQNNAQFSFNQQQDSSNPQLAFQMGQQHASYKSSYAQAPNYSSAPTTDSDEPVSATARQNLEGSISLLA